MKKILRFQLLIIISMISLVTYAQTSSVDLGMVYKIKQEGQANSDMDALAYIFTDLAGPRLTGSAGFDRAAEIAKNQMIKYGFSNVRIETARSFDRGGWENSKAYIAMTAPYYCNFAVTPLAWTSGTNGPVKSEVILVDIKTADDLEMYRGKLKDKAVILSMPSFRPSNGYQVSFEPLATRYTEEELTELAKVEAPRSGNRVGNNIDYRAIMDLQGKVSEFIRSEGVILIIDNGNAFNIPRSTTLWSAGKETPVTEVSVPMEAYGRMQRLLQHGEKVEIEAEINVTFTPGKEVYNVIGEIPGTDPKLRDEVVLLGGHLDSWHAGTGACDNASGCIVMMEALRILKALNVAPRRTIRVALWGGEEQGLYGSRGYVNKYLVEEQKSDGTGGGMGAIPGGEEKPVVHKPAYDKFSVYFNMDNGTGRYRGIYLQGNDLMRPVFEEWMKPFYDMDFKTITIRNTGGTDHLSFDGVGLPGFQFIQDEIEYERGYHTSMDTWERLLIPDLKQNAIITAWFAYNAAMRDQLMPRKPEVKIKDNRRQPMM
jgi:carboxypeptidase Q